MLDQISRIKFHACFCRHRTVPIKFRELCGRCFHSQKNR